MLYRLIALAIIAFWCVMTALLVRLEYRPADAEFLAVPVEHVFKLMFTHRQPSYLDIFEKGADIGRLALRPDEQGARSVAFEGSVRVNAGESFRPQFRYKGGVEFDEALSLQHLDVRFISQRPVSSFSLKIDPPRNKLSYDVVAGDGFASADTVTMDEAGLHQVLSGLGIDDALLAGLSAAKPAGVHVSTRATSLNIHEEKVSVWLVTVRAGEVNFAEIYVSQLGQVLLVRTPLGYELRAIDISL